MKAGQLAAARLHRGISQIVFDLSGSERHISISFSIGITTVDPSCMELETILSRADQALSTAKQDGRNGVCMWQADLE